MTSVLAFIFGAMLGLIVRHAMQHDGFMKYFGTPTGGRYEKPKLELNWGLRQFFLMFDKGMSERWYESRAHLYRGVFISLLSTFHLIHIVRFDFATNREDHFRTTTFITHGFQSIQTLKKKMPDWIKEKSKKVEGAEYWYQTFVAGHNVIGDFMNGDFA